MTEIGIVGGGISSLHLGLKLLSEGIDATILSQQSADEIGNGRLMNSVVHQADTVRRENELGIDQACDPAGFDQAVLSALDEHVPHTSARVDLDTFGLHDGRDLLQGQIQPVVRRAYATSDSEPPVIAIGDLRVTVDPVTGAGANLASFGSWTLGEHVAAHSGPFDEAFARGYEDALMPRTEATVGFNNLVLDPPDCFVGLLLEMADNRSPCDAFTEGFADPVHLWFDCVKDADTAAAFAATHR